MADQPASGVKRKSLSARRKVTNPFPSNIGEYHETHPLGGGAAENAAPAPVAPAAPAGVHAPVENGQHPAPAVTAEPVQPTVAPVIEQPAPVAVQPVQEVAAAPEVAPAPVQPTTVAVAQPDPVQEAPPVQPVVAPAPVQHQAPVQETMPAPDQQPADPAPVEAPAEPAAAPARRSDAPRLSEMKPVPVEPLGEGLFDAYVTGSFIDYPVGVRYEDYIDLNFDQGYNKAFRRMEARVSPLIEDWLEKVARKINDQSRVAGSSKHLNDTRMRNNAVLRTALEKGLRELVIDGATSEASLRALNGLPPAPEQGLFNTFLRDKLRRQQEEFDD